MAAEVNELQNEIKSGLQQKFNEMFKDKLQVQSVDITKQGLKREGTDSIDDYMSTLQQDMLNNLLGQATSVDVFMPTVLDPNVYDQGSLYGMTPFLTFLEAQGRRSPADTSKIDFIEMTDGLQEEWISDDETTTGTGKGAFKNAHATMFVEALPLSFSDILGKGQSATAKAQIMGFAQETMREGLDKAIIAGDNASNSKQFDGLFKMIAGNGFRTSLGGELTVSAVNDVSAGLSEQKKGWADFCLTTETVNNQLIKDMVTTVRQQVVPNYQVAANIMLNTYNSSHGPIPIVVDPYVPNTAAARHFGMLNTKNLFLRDLINQSWVEQGRTKPVATTGWLVQVSTLYNTVPSKTAELYGIT